MVNSTWPTALAFVWRKENDGQGFHSDPDDTGGATNKGITQATWSAEVEHGYISGKLADATDFQLSDILHRRYWLATGCDSLGVGADLCVFNLAMLAGPGRAAFILQSIVGAKQDGVIGPITLKMASVYSPAELIEYFTVKEEEFFFHCSVAWKFLNGWDRRAEDCRKLARTLVKATKGSVA